VAELDRPLGHVLPDKALVELARTRPVSVQAIRQVRGMSPIAKTRAGELAAALAGASPRAEAPPRRSGAPSLRAQRWTEMVLAIVQLVSEQTRIAPRLLATRADAEDIARAVDEGGVAAAAALPAFTTWRRDVLGTTLEGWLLGRIAIVGDPESSQGFRLLPR
jgi:ribonuclease D